MIFGILGAACGAGCERRPWMSGESDGAATHSGAANAFAPATLRIYPLTRVDREPVSGRAAIILHLELKDRWGDSTKALGTLSVFLFEPEIGLEPGIETQTMRWSLDMTDPDQNAQWFDPSTRTYRITLIDLPSGVERLILQPADRKRGGLRLRATFATVGPEGQERALRDELVIELRGRE